MQDEIETNIEKPSEAQPLLSEGPEKDKSQIDLKKEQTVKTSTELKLKKQKMEVNRPNMGTDNLIKNLEDSQDIVNEGMEKNIEHERAFKGKTGEKIESSEKTPEEPTEPKTWYNKIGSTAQGWVGSMFEGMKNAGGWLGVAGGWLAKNAKSIWNWISTTTQGLWYGGLEMMSNIKVFGVKPFEQFNLTATFGRLRLQMQNQLNHLAAQFSVNEKIAVIGGFSATLYNEIQRQAFTAGKQTSELSNYMSQELQKE